MIIPSRRTRWRVATPESGYAAISIPSMEVESSQLAEFRKRLGDLIRTEPCARAERSKIDRFAAEQTLQHGLADSEFEARPFPVGHCKGSLPIVDPPVRSYHG